MPEQYSELKSYSKQNFLYAGRIAAGISLGLVWFPKPIQWDPTWRAGLRAREVKYILLKLWGKQVQYLHLLYSIVINENQEKDLPLISDQNIILYCVQHVRTKDKSQYFVQEMNNKWKSVKRYHWVTLPYGQKFKSVKSYWPSCRHRKFSFW